MTRYTGITHPWGSSTNRMHVMIEPDVYRRLMTAVTVAREKSSEISGLGRLIPEIWVEKGGTWKKSDRKFSGLMNSDLKQLPENIIIAFRLMTFDILSAEDDAVESNIPGDTLLEFFGRLRTAGFDPVEWKAWIHRHPINGWSSTDEFAIAQTPLGSTPEMARWSVSIVYTATDGLIARYDQYEKAGLPAMTVPLGIVTSGSTILVENLERTTRAEVEAHLAKSRLSAQKDTPGITRAEFWKLLKEPDRTGYEIQRGFQDVDDSWAEEYADDWRDDACPNPLCNGHLIGAKHGVLICPECGSTKSKPKGHPAISTGHKIASALEALSTLLSTASSGAWAIFEDELNKLSAQGAELIAGAVEGMMNSIADYTEDPAAMELFNNLDAILNWLIESKGVES